MSTTFLTYLDSKIRKQFIANIITDKVFLDIYKSLLIGNKVDMIKKLLLYKFICESGVYGINEITINQDNQELFANYLYDTMDKILDKYIKLFA